MAHCVWEGGGRKETKVTTASYAERQSMVLKSIHVFKTHVLSESPGKST